MKEMTIVIDTREQRPFTFENISPRPEIVISTLKTGDYSLLGCEDDICIEPPFKTFYPGLAPHGHEITG
jgi:ERCC4-type nuclease